MEKGNKFDSEYITMSPEELDEARKEGHYQCVVEAQTDGTICWNKEDSRDREPIHTVKAGQRFWCWEFKALEDGSYTHDYANMTPTNVTIETNVELKLVYLCADPDDPVLWNSELDKSPNWT